MVVRLLHTESGGSSTLLITTKLCVSAETVYSPAAAGVKGSSPLEVRKTFSMVLLVVRFHPHTPLTADTFHMVVENIQFECLQQTIISRFDSCIRHLICSSISKARIPVL